MKKEVKRILFAVIISLFCTVSLSGKAFAADASCLSVRSYGDGCIITGCSESASGELIIPDKINGRTVTHIADSAFERRKKLTDISIPDTVTEIGEKAFLSCTALKSVKMSDSVVRLGDSAFSGCYNLKKVILSDNLVTIGREVFYFCKALESVNIPSKLKTVGVNSFFDCSSLKNVVLSENTESILSGAFSNCIFLKSIYLPDTVRSIGKGAFEKCSSLQTVYSGHNEKSFNSVGIGSGNEMLFGADLQFNHNHTKAASVVKVEPSCTAKGYSIYDCPCGAYFKGNYVKANGHNLVDKTTIKAAGCTTTGISLQKCTICDYSKKVTIPVKGHTEKTDKAVAATCTTPGKTKGSHCSVCKTVIKKQLEVPAKGHDYSVKIKDSKHLASKATYTKPAKYFYSCSVCGKISKDKTFTAEKLVLPDVKNLSFTSTESTVTLNWSKITAAKGYVVYKKTSGGNWKTFKTVGTNKLTIGKLSSGDSVTFSVRAYVVEDGTKVYSKKFVSVKTATKPSHPSKVTATQNNTAITLTWNKSKGASGYRVFRYDTKNKKWVVVCSKTQENNYTVRNLGKGVTYKFTVKAYIDTGKQIVWSEKSETLTTATRPASPELKATSYKTAVKLEWKKVANADGYVIYYSENPSSGYKKAGTTTKLSFKKEGLASGKTYYFKAYAYKKLSDGKINSYASAVKKVKTR